MLGGVCSETHSTIAPNVLQPTGETLDSTGEAPLGRWGHATAARSWIYSPEHVFRVFLGEFNVAL